VQVAFLLFALLGLGAAAAANGRPDDDPVDLELAPPAGSPLAQRFAQGS
jgi:hypothetical protein